MHDDGFRVLISAYACETGRGSEPEAGLRAVVAAASRHRVWVITRPNNVESTRSELRRRGVDGDVEIIGHDLGPGWRRVKRRGRVAMNLYYLHWQRTLRTVALDLHKRVGFDLVHHVTFANFARPVGAALQGVPLVWGPVGGAVNTPWGLMTVLGVKGFLEDLGRASARWGASYSWRRLDSRSTLALAQNTETSIRLARRFHTTVLPNALAASVPAFDMLPPSRGHEVLVVGELRPLKGGVLAIDAFSQIENEEAELVFIGDGKDRSRLESRARKLGVGPRVIFAGQLGRTETLERIRTAGAVLLPSLHDESSFVAAETMKLGTPLVLLDHGGPRDLVGFWPDAPHAMVMPGLRRATARRLASAVDRLLDARPLVAMIPNDPISQFDDSLLACYEEACRETSSGIKG